jgi:hypothetical protein
LPPARAVPPPDFDELEERPDPNAELPDADVERAIAAAAAQAGKRGDVARVNATRWDGKTAPEHMDRVVEHLGLSSAERALLAKNGFVVLGRTSFSSYGIAYHEIHRQELPLYVSADSVLQGIFRSHEAIVAAGEEKLVPRLQKVLAGMQDEIAKAGSSYAADVADDADLYLSVARELLETGASAPARANKADVDALVKKANDATGVETIELFGRKRLVDFSFYTPRGPYLRSESLQHYFRAMVWLTRLELNLVSRGARSSSPILDPSETPREATLAMALSDLATRANVRSEISSIERAYRVLSGPREDVPLSELAQLRNNVPLDDADKAAASLRAEIGDKYKRTVNWQVRPYFAPDYPVIATFFGVGITPDATAIAALSPKGNPRVVHAPEAAFVLGQTRGAAFAGAGFDPVAADGARRSLTKARRGPDLYAAWLGAIRGLADPEPNEAVPSFMKTTAFADARLSSAVVGWAQIRHAYVLHAVQVYDEGGCRVPDAWVEPALGVYDGVLEYAKRLEAAKELFPEAEGYAKALTLVVTALRGISEDELAGRPLSQEQMDFLAMVSEYEKPSGYVRHGPARFNGWYTKLFAERRDAFDHAEFLADWFTSTTWHKVSYAGATSPRLGVFVVDVAGKPRAMVGPVSSAIEIIAPLDKRLGDDDRYELWHAKRPAWEASYVAPIPTQPTVSVGAKSATDVEISSITGADVIIETVDEHQATIASARVQPPKTGNTIAVKLTPKPNATGELVGVRVRVPNGAAWTEPRYPAATWGPDSP